MSEMGDVFNEATKFCQWGIAIFGRFVRIAVAADRANTGQAAEKRSRVMFVNSSIVLISAVLASLTAGVLIAYGVCLAMFGLFRMHVQQVAATGLARPVKTAPQIV